MMIPGYAVVTGGFGTSGCSMRAAADGWPHPGLVELPNIVDATPRGRGLPRLISATSVAQWDLEVPVIPPVLMLDEKGGRRCHRDENAGKPRKGLRTKRDSAVWSPWV
jgi:hypothetical protein